jgi:DNA-binding LacI/PurR family transcriptional regulator
MSSIPQAHLTDGITVATRSPYRSKAVRLADRLEVEIADGRWPDGCYLPAEDEMARQLEVARMTLRRALAELESRHRVVRVPRRGVLVSAAPQTGDMPHRRRPRRAIAAVLAARPDQGSASLQGGIERWARENGVSFHLLSSDHDPEGPFAVLEHAEGLGVDGVIILPYPGADQTKVIAELQRRHVPIVCIERRSRSIRVPSVEIDNRMGMYRTVQHLLERHRRPVHYLTLRSDHQADLDRQEGWALAMRDGGYGEQIASHLLQHARSTSDPAYWNEDEPWLHGFELATRCFASGQRRWSMACQKDYVAWGVYRAAAVAGLAVGREVAVTGFDDLSLASRLDPPLTTVHQDLEAKGHQAATLLHRLITRRLGASLQVTLPVELIVRGSS